MTQELTPTAPVAPAELAAALAARMCHDFISPASAIVSGLDLLEDPTAQDMREDAMGLINASARKLISMLAFSRVAFGASAAADTFDARELETLTQGVFAHVRAELDWAVEAPSLNKPAARTLLNLAQIGAGALPTGGKAKVGATQADGRISMSVESIGPRVRVRQEVLAGLRGEPLGEGLAGHWVQAFYLHTLVTAAGGGVAYDIADERALFSAHVPA